MNGTNSPHPTAQSDPDSQIDPHPVRNSASSYSASRFLHHNTGFEVGTVNVYPYKHDHPFSDDPKRCIRLTQEITVNVSHLFRDADLVVMEIGEVLPFVLVVVEDLRQRFVAALVGIDIGVAAFVGVLLQ